MNQVGGGGAARGGRRKVRRGRSFSGFRRRGPGPPRDRAPARPPPSQGGQSDDDDNEGEGGAVEEGRAADGSRSAAASAVARSAGGDPTTKFVGVTWNRRAHKWEVGLFNSQSYLLRTVDALCSFVCFLAFGGWVVGRCEFTLQVATRTLAPLMTSSKQRTSNFQNVHNVSMLQLLKIYFLSGGALVTLLCGSRYDEHAARYGKPMNFPRQGLSQVRLTLGFQHP